MPASPQAAAQAPAPPVPPTPAEPGAATASQGAIPTAIVSVPRTDGVPQTRDAVLSLRAQRSELSSQLTSAARRRSDLATQLESASAAERPGLEARIAQLDGRMLEIEAEIARTGQLIAQAPGELLSARAPANPGGIAMRVDWTAIGVVFTMFVLAPIALAAARLLWKRATHHLPPAIDRETTERLRRLESGVDAIAIEVERISEGQRFVTKLMSEREQSRIGAPRD